jgi:signal transduction histidine kinase
VDWTQAGDPEFARLFEEQAALRRVATLVARGTTVAELVAQALTNVARYASAHSASVIVRRDADDVLVEVTDDGSGGAEPDAGTGLRGHIDRVEALGGRLEVQSPVERGTTVRARLPGI